MKDFENNIQKIRDNLEEINCIIDDLDLTDEDNMIKNLDNFIFKLKCENLYTEQIENFIENYMKFYND